MGKTDVRNYFNYFTEVEEYFVRRRGKNIIVSPLDWCLIELWKANGIPLHIVLRGIDRSFESTQKRQKQTPKSLYYCLPAIIEIFEEHNLSLLGTSHATSQSDSPDSPSPEGFCRKDVLEYLEELENSIKEQRGEVFDRSIKQLAALKSELKSAQTSNYEALDRSLGQIGEILAEVLRRKLSVKQTKDLEKEVNREMKIYRKRLSKDMYGRLKQNYLNGKVRDLFGLPEFTLLQRTTEY